MFVNWVLFYESNKSGDSYAAKKAKKRSRVGITDAKVLESIGNRRAPRGGEGGTPLPQFWIVIVCPIFIKSVIFCDFQRLEIKAKKFKIFDAATDDELRAFGKELSKLDEDIDQIEAKDQIPMYPRVLTS